MSNMRLGKILYCLLLGFLVWFTYGKVLDFTFWKDDWGYYWSLLHHIPYSAFWLHPGTPLEFLAGIALFGTNTAWWQGVGLLLRFIAAFATASMAYALTKSRRTGMITGILMATTVYGMDAVGWISAHVLLLNIITVCSGFYFFLRREETGSIKDRILMTVFFLAALIIDPGRNCIIIPLIYWYFLVFQKNTLNRMHHTRDMRWLVLCGVAACIAIFFGSLLVTGTAIGTFIGDMIRQPALLLEKRYVAAKFFHAFGVMTVGWLSRIPEFDNTVEYDRILFRIGMGFLVIAGSLGFWKRRTFSGAIVLFCLGWMVLAFIPNWLFEPRLTVGVTHRYMSGMSVGFLLLLSYALARLPYRWLIGPAVAGYVFCTILGVHHKLDNYYPQRAKHTTDAILNAISSQVPTLSSAVIFVTGNHPILYPGLYYSMPLPLSVLRKQDAIEDIPLSFREFTGLNNRELFSRICTPEISRNIFGRTVVYAEGIRISDIYHFVINPDATVTNQTDAMRLMLIKEGDTYGCRFKSEEGRQ